MKSYLIIILLAFLNLFAEKAEAAYSLKPFIADGCTMFVDGTPKQPELWRHCCDEHDMRYWIGGGQADMDKTDLRLKACVNEVAGPTWAQLIYVGVRSGHSSPVKSKTHWSWGWSQERDNTELNPAEVNYVIEELYRLPYDQEVIEQFIKRNFKNNAQI